MTWMASRWRQVAACMVLLSANALAAASYSLFAVPFTREFHVSRMTVMLAMTVMSLVSAILSPLLGTLMDRIPLRYLAMLGSVAMATGFAALSFTTSFVHVLLVYGLLIAPANILLGTMLAAVLLSRWFVDKRGAAIGIAVSGIAFGGLIFPPIAQALLDSMPWRSAFLALALIVLVWTLPAAWCLVDRPTLAKESAVHLQSDKTVQPGTISVKAVLTRPAFWLAAAAFAVVLSGMKGLITNLAPLVLDQGIAPAQAAWLLSINAAFLIISKLTSAAVADRMRSVTLLALALTGFGLGMLLLTQAHHGFWFIAAGVSVVGLFGGLAVPFQGLFVSRLFGPHVVGRVSGLMTTVTLCALLVSPPLFGRIYDVTGSYDAIFQLFAAAALAALLAVLYLRRHLREDAVGTVSDPAVASQTRVAAANAVA